MPSTYGFLREYLRPSTARIETREATFARADEQLEATIYRPRGARGTLPGWVLLHGLTVPGRRHESLDRFARAIAASGAIVFIPDVPEWRRLQLASGSAVLTIKSAVVALSGLEEVRSGRTAVLGFSFGGTQALIAAADPALQGLLGAVASWGGYRDVRRLFQFAVTGVHELDGAIHRIEPDPYGRWIAAGNFLRLLPEYQADHELAEAFLRLAAEAGRLRIKAWDSSFDSVIAVQRAALAARHRPLFDLLAPPSGVPIVDEERATSLMNALAEAALRSQPLLDPGAFLPDIALPALLAHGRDDRLVPFTETLRLQRLIPRARLQHTTITALFAHSGGAAPGLGLRGTARELLLFKRLLDEILDLV